MRNKGFTLIELMIVVAIIAIIAAIAIPSLLRSRMAANETASAAACKAYAEAQEIFHRTDWDRDQVLEYSTTMGTTIGGAQATCNQPTVAAAQIFPNLIDRDVADDALVQCVDRALAAGEGDVTIGVPKAGYVFSTIYGRSVAGGAATVYDTLAGLTLGYAFSAIPSSYDGTGKNQFMISNTGTIYQIDAEYPGGVNPAHMSVFDISVQPTGAGAGASTLWTASE